jgi:hypothetical protein
MRGLAVIAALTVACSRGSPPPSSSGPPRFVTLTPSATEVVAALDAT